MMKTNVNPHICLYKVSRKTARLALCLQSPAKKNAALFNLPHIPRTPWLSASRPVSRTPGISPLWRPMSHSCVLLWAAIVHRCSKSPSSVGLREAAWVSSNLELQACSRPASLSHWLSLQWSCAAASVARTLAKMISGSCAKCVSPRKRHSRKFFEATCKRRPPCKVIGVCVTFTFAVKRNVSFYDFSWFKMRPVKCKCKTRAVWCCICTALETEPELKNLNWNTFFFFLW